METFLALDPGETTGWALFNLQEPKPIQMGGAAYGEDLYKLLMMMDPKFFIVEEFMVRTARVGKQQGIKYTKEWDKVVTARAIGMIESRAFHIGCPVYFQQASILSSMAQKYGFPSKGHLRSAQHPVDAILHGYYYAEKHLGLLPPYNPVEVKPVEKKPTVIVQINNYRDIRKAMKKRKS